MPWTTLSFFAVLVVFINKFICLKKMLVYSYLASEDDVRTESAQRKKNKKIKK